MTCKSATQVEKALALTSVREMDVSTKFQTNGFFFLSRWVIYVPGEDITEEDVL